MPKAPPNKFLLFAVAALALSAGNAIAQSSAVSVTAEKPATIEGMVTHATTGEPLPRVHVTLRSSNYGAPNSYGAMTGADGKFSVTGIVPGSYIVAGERTGFVMEPNSHGFLNISLNSDEKKSDFALKLYPTGAILGRVTDSEGEPVENASVTAEGEMITESAGTDDKGRFRIGGLAPGSYRVRAAPPNAMIPLGPEIRTDGTVDVRHASTYFPGGLTAKEAARVVVRPAGDTDGIDIQLIRVPWVRVSGRVTGNFHPPDHVFVFAERLGVNVPQVGGRVRSDGAFEFWRLDPGRYVLTGGWNTGGQSLQTAPIEIEVASSNIEGLELRYVPAFDLGGRLEFETEEAKQIPKSAAVLQPGTQAGGQPAKPHRSLTLRAVGTRFNTIAPAVVQDDDTFVFTKVPPGRYRVAPSWNTVYVRSVRLGTTVIDGAVIDLSNGANGADVSVTLAAANASITGNVQDEKGQGTVVLLVQDTPDRTGNLRYAEVKGDGTFSFLNLPPGRYHIEAVPNNDVPADYENFGEAIELHSGETVTKDLKRRTPAEP